MQVGEYAGLCGRTAAGGVVEDALQERGQVDVRVRVRRQLRVQLRHSRKEGFEGTLPEVTHSTGTVIVAVANAKYADYSCPFSSLA